MVGEWPNGETARIECRYWAAYQFVHTKASRSYEHHHQNGSADQRSSVPPDFSEEYSTGRRRR